MKRLRGICFIIFFALIACTDSLFARTHPRLQVDVDDVEYHQYDSTNYRIQIDTSIYVVGDSSATTFYGDGSNLTGIDIENECLYTVVVATYSGTGVDYACNGTDDQVEINNAITDANGVGTVFIRGGDYVLTSTVTINVRYTKILCDDSVFKWDSSVTTNMDMVHISVADVLIEGLVIDGSGDDNFHYGIWFDASGDAGTLRYCEVKNKPSVASSFGIVVAGTECLMVNCKLTNVDGNQSLWVSANNMTVNGLIVSGSASYMNLSGNGGLYTNISVTTSGGDGIAIWLGGTETLLSNFIINYQIAGCGIQVNAYGSTIANGYINDTTKDGITILNYNVLVSDVLIKGVGTGASNTEDAISIGSSAHYTTLNGVKITEAIDRYAISVHASATNTSINNCVFKSITGNVGIILDDSNQANITNCQPYDTIENELQASTTFYDNLTTKGTFYYNASYAHGYARDVVVAVTGSTSTFVILDATWSQTVTASGFTISGASCTYNGRGGTPKIFKVSGAFSAISGAANTVVYWALFKNGVLYESAIINRKISVAADVGAMALSTLIELTTGDILDIRLSGDNNTNITNKFMQFDIIQVN